MSERNDQIKALQDFVLGAKVETTVAGQISIANALEKIKDPEDDDEEEEKKEKK